MLKLKDILVEINDIPNGLGDYSQLRYTGYFYSFSDPTDIVPIGYHNYHINPDCAGITGGQIPASETDGSLRFTGLPYIQSHNNSDKTAIIGNGFFGGAIHISYPKNISAFLRSVNSQGSAY